MTTQQELNWNHAIETEDFDYAEQIATATKLAASVTSPAIEAATEIAAS